MGRELDSDYAFDERHFVNLDFPQLVCFSAPGEVSESVLLKPATVEGRARVNADKIEKSFFPAHPHALVVEHDPEAELPDAGLAHEVGAPRKEVALSLAQLLRNTIAVLMDGSEADSAGAELALRIIQLSGLEG